MASAPPRTSETQEGSAHARHPSRQRWERLLSIAPVLLLSMGCAYCGGNGGRKPSAVSRVSTPTASGLVGEGSDGAARSHLGTNLAALVDWSTEEPFVDLFKLTRAPISGAPEVWRDERPLDLDARGQVRSLARGQVARTLVLTDSGRHRPGRYVATFSGRGELRWGGVARQLEAESRPGRHVLELGPSEVGATGIVLELTRTDPRDPVRDLRIVPQGGACDEDRTRFCDEASPCDHGACLSFEEHRDQLLFHPDFLARVAPFRMIRFMDFMATNDSTIRRWSERPRLEDATWTVRGAPVEVMAHLVNLLHAQPWLCVPHQADDEYVRELASSLRSLVDPDLPIWIEYSNEVWNGIFEQHHYAVQQGEALGLGEGLVAALRFYARRSREIFRIFTEILGAERVVRVAAAQSANVWVAGQILEHDGLAREVDALAIAPYFGLTVGPEERDRVRALTVDDLVTETRERLLPEALRGVAEHAALARRHGLRLVAYEAGQHFVGVGGVEDDAQINARFDALNRDPRMRDLYLAYLEGWRAHGGGWLNHFTSCERYTQWGRWGALEHIRQPREGAPKYDALMLFRERYPSGW